MAAGSGQGRMSKAVMEFFLLVLRRVCERLELPVAIGTHRLGQEMHVAEDVGLLKLKISNMKSWDEWMKTRFGQAKSLLIPVIRDEGKVPRDCVLVRVQPNGSTGTLAEASQYDVLVVDASEAVDEIRGVGAGPPAPLTGPHVPERDDAAAMGARMGDGEQPRSFDGGGGGATGGLPSSAVPPTLLSAAEEAALLQSTSAQLDQLAHDVVADWWALQDELLLRFGDGYEFAWGAEGPAGGGPGAERLARGWTG